MKYSIYLIFSITWAIHAEPFITDFNFNQDIGVVEKLLKSEWNKLFYQPNYDQCLISKIFKLRRPGDVAFQEKELTIKILRDQNKILGFITYYQPNPKTNHIELLAVDSEHRGKGYGKKLIEHVIYEGLKKGLKTVQLYVYPSNQAAIKIYQHLGFEIQAEYPGYLLLTKKLANMQSE